MSEPHFHVICVFNSALMNFEVVYVSSSEFEARARLPHEKEQHKGTQTFGPLEMTLTQLKETLLEAKLGKLHDVLLRLEALVAPSSTNTAVSVEGGYQPIARPGASDAIPPGAE